MLELRDLFDIENKYYYEITGRTYSLAPCNEDIELLQLDKNSEEGKNTSEWDHQEEILYWGEAFQWKTENIEKRRTWSNIEENWAFGWQMVSGYILKI